MVSAGSGLSLLDCFLSNLLKPLQKAYMILAGLILFVLFFMVITPISLFARLLNRDLLRLKIDRDSCSSYWIPKRKGEVKKSDYEKQF